MRIKFSKYQGTGNDFIMIHENDLHGKSLGLAEIRLLCDRHFGIGADGLIIIQTKPDVDFYVDYYNADGTQSFCGNGARCSVQFAKDLGLINSSTQFKAIDGLHEAEILSDGLVKLKMSPVQNIEVLNTNTFVLDTGSPHYVEFIEKIENQDIIEYGRKIRNAPEYKMLGINVNLAEKKDQAIHMMTYERGVENETLSCGTGVTAVALADALQNENLQKGVNRIQTKGGTLSVEWVKSAEGFSEIYLIGPAKKVFEGEINI